MENASAPYEKPPPYSPTDTSPYSPGAQNTYYQQYGYPPYPQPQPQPQPMPQPMPSVHPMPGTRTPLVNPSVYPPQAYGGTTPVNIQTNEIIIVGGCPICRVGVLETDYPCVGILCAILFFPLGILCCLALREKRCSNCGVQLS